MFKNTFVSLLTAFFIIGTAISISGCNTIAGAGQDIEKGGKAVKDEANEHK